MKANLFVALIILVGATSLESQEVAREPGATHPGRSVEMVILAERFAGGVSVPQPKADRPVAYVAVDGGLLEGGQSVAGEKPPSVATMADTLSDALDAQFYTPVQAGGAPTVLITYHWGILRAELDSNNIYADTNSIARLSLVAPAQTVRRIQDEIATRNFVTTPMNTLELPGNREVIELASEPRYFVIVSAYDYSAFARGNPALLWRVKVSAHNNTGSMVNVLPALLRGSAPYFGAHFTKAKKAMIPLVHNESMTSERVRPEISQTNKTELLTKVIERERAQFSGENLGVWRKRNSAGQIDPRRAIAISAIALQTEAALRHPRPSLRSPVFYLTCDAGPVGILAGAKPPDAEVVGHALKAALRKQGYQPAGPETQPALLLVYHWGAESATIAGGQGDGTLNEAATVFQNVVVVSAYDYGDLLRKQRTLLWRTKLMAPQSGKMNEVLPALIIGGGGFLGRNFQQLQQAVVPRSGLTETESTDDALPSSAPSGSPGKLEDEVLREVVAWERDGFYRLQEGSSSLILDTEGKPFGLPSSLAKRITVYLQRKFELQNALASSVKALPPGADSKKVIDAFSKRNSSDILALVRERDAIRVSLAQFAAGRPRQADDEPLAAILRAFAADTRPEELPPGPAGG